MADREPSVALVSDPITVKVGLVGVDSIGAIVDWASVRFKFWIAETVIVRVGARVAGISKAVFVCIRLAFRVAWNHGKPR